MPAGFARHAVRPQGVPDRDLLVRDRDVPVRLDRDEWLEREGVPRIADRVRGGDEVRERAVEVVQRVRERLLQRPAALQLVREVDADHFRVVLAEEPDALLLVHASQPVVVGDVAVVDRRQVRHAVGPEGLRMREVHPALGGQSGVPDCVAAAHRGDPERRLEARRRTDLLHELQVLADAHDLGVLARAFECPGDGARRRIEPQLQPQEVAVALDVADLGEAAEPGAHDILGGRDIAAGRNADPRDVGPVRVRPEAGDPCRVRSAAGKPRQHVEQDAPHGLIRADARQVARDATHAPPHDLHAGLFADSTLRQHSGTQREFQRSDRRLTCRRRVADRSASQ